MRKSRKQLEQTEKHEVAITGRKRPKDSPNSFRFLVEIEGVTDYDGRVRGANGIRWQVA